MKPIISIVIIGLNEGKNLADCLLSVKSVRDKYNYKAEIIYVDGGSEDNSLEIAERAGIDMIFGGEKKRRAAENRNIGLEHAKGQYVQFLDGDMLLDDLWLESGLSLLEKRNDIAVVCGNLNEQNRSIISQAFEIDWGIREESIRHCGGAALWRRSILTRMGGFPEEVFSGEEPYLCWRVRNELGLSIYQLNTSMVVHDLGHITFVDYWKRNMRTGHIYAEISEKVKNTPDPLWLKEVRNNYIWLIIYCIALPALIIPVFFPWSNLLSFSFLCLVFLRKAIQNMNMGTQLSVSLAYAGHTYFCKIPIALGQLSWHLDNYRKKRGDSC